ERVKDLELGQVHAHAQGKNRDRAERESWRAPQSPHAVSEILANALHRNSSIQLRYEPLRCRSGVAVVVGPSAMGRPGASAHFFPARATDGAGLERRSRGGAG